MSQHQSSQCEGFLCECSLGGLVSPVVRCWSNNQSCPTAPGTESGEGGHQSCSNSVVVWKEAMASLLPDLEVKDEIKLDSKRLLTVNPHDNKEEGRPCCVRV